MRDHHSPCTPPLIFAAHQPIAPPPICSTIPPSSSSSWTSTLTTRDVVSSFPSRPTLQKLQRSSHCRRHPRRRQRRWRRSIPPTAKMTYPTRYACDYCRPAAQGMQSTSQRIDDLSHEIRLRLLSACGSGDAVDVAARTPRITSKMERRDSVVAASSSKKELCPSILYHPVHRAKEQTGERH